MIEIEQEFLNEEDVCLVTGKIIPKGDRSRWTDEFDAWVSEEGQRLIEESATGLNPDPESEIIYREWYWKDEAVAGREAEWHAEQTAKFNDD